MVALKTSAKNLILFDVAFFKTRWFLFLSEHFGKMGVVFFLFFDQIRPRKDWQVCTDLPDNTPRPRTLDRDLPGANRGKNVCIHTYLSHVTQVDIFSIYRTLWYFWDLFMQTEPFPAHPTALHNMCLRQHQPTSPQLPWCPWHGHDQMAVFSSNVTVLHPNKQTKKIIKTTYYTMDISLHIAIQNCSVWNGKKGLTWTSRTSSSTVWCTSPSMT